MKLLVCISKTPETTAKIQFTDGNTKYDESGVSFIMNPYDEWYALVRALELKEAAGGSVTVVNVGPASNDSTIRKALAIGADDAVRIDAEPHNAKQTAKLISDYAQAQGYDIIFTGKETIDYNGSQVGGMIAEYMGLPYVSYVSQMEMNDGTAQVTRDVEGGVEVLDVPTPFVISAAKGLAEQRIPNMRGIMMAKRKQLNVEAVELPSIGATIEKFTLPPAKGDVKMIDPENMDELVRLLHEEAKVI